MPYLVAYFDTNGVGRLVGEPNDFDSEAHAAARIAEIESAHAKPHKVDYRIIPYERGYRREALNTHGIEF